MSNYLYVFIGGGLGSVCRFGIGHAMSFWRPSFPWATLLANVLACLVLGLLVGLSVKGKLGGPASVLLMAGFCGGFSTFSTFTNDTIQMLAAGLWWKAVANILASMVACFVALYIGMKITGH